MADALGPDRVFWTDNGISPPLAVARGLNVSGAPAGVVNTNATNTTDPSSTTDPSKTLELIASEAQRISSTKQHGNPGLDLFAVVDLFLMSR